MEENSHEEITHFGKLRDARLERRIQRGIDMGKLRELEGQTEVMLVARNDGRREEKADTESGNKESKKPWVAR